MVGVAMKLPAVCFVVVLPCPAIGFSAGNGRIQTFSKAKKIFLKNIYSDQNQTFYCRSTFITKNQVFPTGGYVPAKDNKGANRLECEHVVHAHAFG